MPGLVVFLHLLLPLRTFQARSQPLPEDPKPSWKPSVQHTMFSLLGKSCVRVILTLEPDEYQSTCAHVHGSSLVMHARCAFSCLPWSMLLQHKRGFSHCLANVTGAWTVQHFPFPPTGTRCWCRFKVGSTYDAAKNRLAFPRPELVRDHFITSLYTSMLSQRQQWFTMCVYSC